MRRLALILVLSTSATVFADAPAPAPATAIDGQARNYEQPPEPESIPGSGIGDAVGTGVAWIVRVVVAPFRAGIYLQARYNLYQTVKSWLTNDAETVGVFPDGSYETAFGLSYGARAFWKKLTADDDKIELSGKAGGAFRDAFQLRYDAPHFAGSHIYVHARARYEDAVNSYFAGIGNGKVDQGTNLSAMAGDVATRFAQHRELGLLSSGVELGHPGALVRIGGSAIFNHRTFGRSEGASEPTVQDVYDTSTLRGFNNGFSNLELTADIELDTRDTEGPTQHGALVRAFGGGGSIVESATYAHYGAEAVYYLTPGWERRTLVFRAVLEGVVDRDDDIPFTELPRLGGAFFLRGYHTDTFRDKLASMGTIEYHYPIHNNVSGALYVDAGKVARTYDELAGAGLKDNWHVGYGAGLLLHTKDTIAVRVDIAYGDGINFYISTDVLDAFRRREREL